MQQQNSGNNIYLAQRHKAPTPSSSRQLNTTATTRIKKARTDTTENGTTHKSRREYRDEAQEIRGREQRIREHDKKTRRQDRNRKRAGAARVAAQKLMLLSLIACCRRLYCAAGVAAEATLSLETTDAADVAELMLESRC